tara:strand:+ start:480 stop:866 length:387 start_codon:yes stop_codon:yes gene_type:complete
LQDRTNFGQISLRDILLDKLPDAFLSYTTIKKVIDYLEAGGTLFLSALGLHYVADLGIEENGDPRVSQPLGKDPPEIGVTPTAKGKKHPVFKGFDTSDCIAFGQGFPTGGVILATKTRGVWRAQGNVQ